MRSHKNLISQLCDFMHLYHSFQKAMKGSGKTQEVLDFEFNLEKELLQLRQELMSQSYQASPFRYFYIQKPKSRCISVAPFRDRVVHHAIVSILDQIFEPAFIYHSYATRKNKGTLKAVLQAQNYLKSYSWFYKADIDQYFSSIDHGILLSLLGRKVQDQHFMDLLQKILTNGGSAGKGLPIGNLTSQFFANVYLNPFDH